MCKTNKQEANTSVFVLFSSQGVAIKAVQSGMPQFLDSVIVLSLSDILYDEGTILNHDNTCPCNPLRRKKKTLDIIRYSAFLTNSNSAKSQL